VSTSEVWGLFQHDPRDPQYAALRASDRDRAVVSDLLAEAYAEGRLDRDELDERTATVTSARTYADLVPPIRDLTLGSTSQLPALTESSELRRRAERHYDKQRAEALWGFLVPNLICWAIFFFSGMGFPWPVFVTIGTGANVLRILSTRASIIEERMESLKRKETRALESKAELHRRAESD
ncbi:MAG: DUF1707 SHOCT-like domain-containing protein, partial [Nocardioides sp.]